MRRHLACWLGCIGILCSCATASGQSLENVVVVCPLSIDTDDYRYLLYAPDEFYKKYSKYIRVVPLELLHTREAVPEACVPNDDDYFCKGCEDIIVTYYECFHTVVPTQQSDCKDNWCIQVDVKAKTCHKSGRQEGRVDCRVKFVNRSEYERKCNIRIDPVRTQTVKYRGRHGDSWCRVESLGPRVAMALWGCPDCDQFQRVRVFCLADTRSREICKNGLPVHPRLLEGENPIKDKMGFICTEADCECRRHDENRDPEDGDGERSKENS